MIKHLSTVVLCGIFMLMLFIGESVGWLIFDNSYKYNFKRYPDALFVCVTLSERMSSTNTALCPTNIYLNGDVQYFGHLRFEHLFMISINYYSTLKINHTKHFL